MKMVVMPQ